MQTATTSKQFQLNLSDGVKSFIIAIATPVIYMLQELIPGWNISPILKAAISATLAYLLKNFLTPGKIMVSGASAEVIQSVQDGDTTVKVGNTVAEVTTPTAKP